MVCAIFEDTGIHFTTHGRRYLGAAIGSADFVQSFVNDKVKEWSDKLSYVRRMVLLSDMPHILLLERSTFCQQDCLE